MGHPAMTHTDWFSVARLALAAYLTTKEKLQLQQLPSSLSSAMGKSTIPAPTDEVLCTILAREVPLLLQRKWSNLWPKSEMPAYHADRSPKND